MNDLFCFYSWINPDRWIFLDCALQDYQLDMSKILANDKFVWLWILLLTYFNFEAWKKKLVLLKATYNLIYKCDDFYNIQIDMIILWRFTK